ncbi:hypothetical protein OKW50_004138 [Paraburkholderia youngii]
MIPTQRLHSAKVGHELGKRRIAFIAARELLGENPLGPKLKAAVGGPYMANEKLMQASAQQALEADAIAWGSSL